MKIDTFKLVTSLETYETEILETFKIMDRWCVTHQRRSHSAEFTVSDYTLGRAIAHGKERHLARRAARKVVADAIKKGRYGELHHYAVVNTELVNDNEEFQG